MLKFNSLVRALKPLLPFSLTFMKNINPTAGEAFIVTASPDNIAKAAKRIQDGQLVSFSTETVYGLGANGLDH